MVDDLTAHFSDDSGAFAERLKSNLGEAAGALTQFGERINTQQIGENFGQSLIDRLNTIANEAQRKVRQIQEQTEAASHAAAFTASTTPGTSASAHYTGPGAGGSPAIRGQAEEIGQQAVRDVLDAVRTAVSGLPAEMAHLGPQLEALGNIFVDGVAKTTQQSYTTASETMRSRLGREADLFLTGIAPPPEPKSAYQRVQEAFRQQSQGQQPNVEQVIRGAAISPPSSPAEAVRAQALVADQMARSAQQQIDQARSQLANISERALLEEARDPNKPGTYFGTPQTKYQQLSYGPTTPITREDEVGWQAVTFKGIPKFTPAEEAGGQSGQVNAQLIEAQTLAAAQNRISRERAAEEEADRVQRNRESIYTGLSSGQLTPIGGTATNPRYARDVATGELHVPSTGETTNNPVDLFAAQKLEGDALHKSNEQHQREYEARERAIDAIQSYALGLNKAHDQLQEQATRQELFTALQRPDTDLQTIGGTRGNPAYIKDTATGDYLDPKTGREITASDELYRAKETETLQQERVGAALAKEIEARLAAAAEEARSQAVQARFTQLLEQQLGIAQHGLQTIGSPGNPSFIRDTNTNEFRDPKTDQVITDSDQLLRANQALRDQEERLGTALAQSVESAIKQKEESDRLARVQQLFAELLAQQAGTFNHNLQTIGSPGNPSFVRDLNTNKFYDPKTATEVTDNDQLLKANQQLREQEERLATAMASDIEAIQKATAAADAEARVRQLFTDAAKPGSVYRPIGSAANPNAFQNTQTGAFYSTKDGAQITDPKGLYQANVQAQQQDARANQALARARAAAASADEKTQNPNALQAFLGGLTSKGYEAPGVGISSLFGTTGVLARYSTAGAGIGAMFAALTQLKEGIIGVDGAQHELDIALQSTKANTVDTSTAFGDLASAVGIDGSQALQIGAQALIAYQAEIKNSADATQVFEQAVTQAGIAAINTGLSATEAFTALKQGNLGFGTADQSGAGAARINDAVANAAKLTGGNQAAILQGVGSSSDVASLAGLSQEQTAVLLGMINARTGQTGTALGGDLTRLVSRDQSSQFLKSLNTANVPNTGNIGEEIVQLSNHYHTLDTAAQSAFVRQIAGGKSIGALAAIFENGNKLTVDSQKALDGQGLAAQQAAKRNESLAGQLRIVGALIKDVFQNAGRSGAFAGFEVALATLKPLLQLVNQMLQAFNALPKPIRETAGALLDAAIALKILAAVKNPESLVLVKNIAGRAGHLGGAPVADAALAGAPVIAGAPLAPGVTPTVVAGTAGVVGSEVTGFNAAIAGEAARIRAESAANATLREEAAIQEAESRIVAAEQGTLAEKSAARIAADQILQSGINVAAAIKAAGELEVAAMESAAAQFATAAEVAAAAEAGGAAGSSLFSRIGAGFGAGGLFGGARNAAGELGAAGRGLLGRAAPLLGPAAAIAGGAFAIHEVYQTDQKIQRSEQAGHDALAAAAPGGSSDLRTSADALTNASKDIGKASSGIVGTVAGAIGEVTGNIFGQGNTENRGTERRILQQTADARKAEADRIDAARTAAIDVATKGDPTTSKFGASLDFSSTDALSASIQTLSERGATAAQVVSALNLAINQMISSAAGGSKVLLPGQAGVFSATAGASTVNSLIGSVQQYQTFAANNINSDGSNAGQILGSLDISKNILSGKNKQVLERGGGLADLNQKDLSKELTDDFNAHFKQQGYDNGKKIDTKELFAFAEDALRKRLGLTVKEYASMDPILRQQLRGAAQVGILDALKETGNGPGGPSQQNLRDYVTNIVKLAPQVGQQAAASATNTGATDGGGVTGAKATLDSLLTARQTIEKALKNAKTPGDIQADTLLLQTVTANIVTAQNGLATATATHLEAMSALAVAQSPENDKLGRLDKQIAGVQDLLKQPHLDADTKRGYETRLLDLRNQRQDQALAQANAVRDAAVDPRDRVGGLQAAAQDAADAYTAALAGHGTASPAEALKAKRAAEQAYTDALRQQTNQQRDANVQVGDTVGDAQAAWADALNIASGDIAGSAQQAADLKTAQEKYLAFLQAQAQNASVLAQLHEDTTDPIVQAQQALNDAYTKLGNDRKANVGQPTINADLLDIQNKQNAEQKTTFDTKLQATQDEYDLNRESGAAYIQSLRNLRAGIIGNSYQAQQERIAVDKALKSAYGSLTGQFNVGDIKVPSVYEVRRSIGAASAGQQFSNTTTNSIVINGIGSTEEVVAIVKSQLGTVAVSRRAPTINRRV